MSNEIKNEFNNNNDLENIEKTSNIIIGINAVVIGNVEESSNKTVTEETNFTKNEVILDDNTHTYSQINDKNINNENYNSINNENTINNNQNDYNQNNNINENNFNQSNQGNYEVDNTISSTKENETSNNSNDLYHNNPHYNYNTNNQSNNIEQNQNIPPEPVQTHPPMFTSNHGSSSKIPSKKRSSYDKKGSKNSLKDLAFRFPMKESFSKVEVPFSFQQNLDDPDKDSHFHSYIRITGTPTLYMDISDDHKIDKLNMVSNIDSLKNLNKELEKKLKGIDDNIMKFKEDNTLLNKEIEKTKNEILARNNEINKLKQTIQQLNQGNNKYDNDIKLKLQEKNNSYIKLK